MPTNPSVIELSALDGDNGFRINGEAVRDFSGSSVASAGDVNGDGFDDLIIGAPAADPNGEESGASYVVFGAATGLASSRELSALDGGNGFRINGNVAYSSSGRSVAGAGDINGDGFDDLIIGAPSYEPSIYYIGQTFVVFGKASGFSSTLELSSLDGINGFRFTGEDTYGFSGQSVSSAGDINGDGFADMIIGAPGADPNGNISGASYVVFGKAGGFAANLQPSALNGTNGFQTNGDAANDRSGSSVAGAGDVDGDGFADLIIGGPGVDPGGASYVVFGKGSGFTSSLELSALDGSNGFRINGEAGDVSGRSVAGAGDVNGDGFADLIIGAPGADPNGNISGASYVVFGKGGGFTSSLELSTLDGANGFQINGEVENDLSGLLVASAGDVNGDGFADLIIATYRADRNGTDRGVTYVVFGKAGGFASSVELSALDGANGFRIIGEAAGDESGISAASAGDINDDGFDDLIIGAPIADPNGDRSGASYVIYGRATGTLDRSGSDSADTLGGGDWDDTLSGLGGNDKLRSGAGADVINGGADNDLLNGEAGDDLVAGGSGNDTVSGGGGDDTLRGQDGNDRLDGGAGNDDIIAGSGNDIIKASTGDDSIDGGSGSDRLSIGGNIAGPVVVDLQAGSAVFASGISYRLLHVEQVLATRAADNLSGNGEANLLSGRGGKDTLVGRGGNDTLNGGGGGDEMQGGAGNDTYVVNSTRDTVIEAAAAGNDAIRSRVSLTLSANVERLSLIGKSAINGTGNELANLLTGNAANNVLNGGDGNDTLSGGQGNDTMNGGTGNDSYQFALGDGFDQVLDPGGDADRLAVRAFGDIASSQRLGNNLVVTLTDNSKLAVLNHFNAANQVESVIDANGVKVVLAAGTIGGLASGIISGTGHADTLDGKGGDDLLFGNGGNDLLIGGAGADSLRGGGGSDLLRGGGRNDSLFGEAGADSLSGGAGRDVLNGGGGADRLDGGKGKDNLAGGNGNDSLTGGPDNDQLLGGSGNDTLNGGGDKDTLTGGRGRDMLTGGAGSDRFVFNSRADSTPDSQRDHIVDFVKNAELIDLSGIDAQRGVAGDQAFSFIPGGGAFTGAKGDLRVVNSGTNTRVSGDVNGDKNADFSIVVENVNNLDAGDFVL